MSKNDILIIDDSNTNIVLLESLFKRNGYRVLSAMNGQEGLDSVKKKIPDLIFLDLKMPGIDGFEFMERLRKNEEWRDIPVIILSAVSNKETVMKSIELGVVEYLTKPLNIEKVVAITRNILDNKEFRV